MATQQIALLQMVSTNDLESNLQQAAGLVRQAAEQGAGLALLPENFAYYGGGQTRALGEAESVPDGGPIQAFLAQQSREHKLWLVAGSLPLAHRPDGQPVAGGRVRPSCLVYDAQGQCQARYDKLHLFDATIADQQARYLESELFEPGEYPVTVDSPVGRLGLSICYDLRFAALYKALRGLGAQCLLVPSAFTYLTGQAHWEALLRARAIENQCWVLATNQGGWHNHRRRTWGHSMVVNPWGEVVAQATEDGPQVVLADMDMGILERVRREMPVWEHRRQW
ncbi:MAG: carbon-nitrogen hydrolase family protein [Halomonadaceae bacterium]|nr:MAG: carbon-nitrogen hydrolase family protein [Halomonadaceae bacterium]